ncbi:MAG: TlpA disulfide reductase family protein [Steroidobacteraceae bacterium]
MNFWSNWCVPLRARIPELIRVQRRHPELTVIRIRAQESPESVREFARAYEIDYRVLLAGAQGVPLLVALGNPAAGLPYTLLLDRDGRVLARRLSGMSRADLRARPATAAPRALSLQRAPARRCRRSARARSTPSQAPARANSSPAGRAGNGQAGASSSAAAAAANRPSCGAPCAAR